MCAVSMANASARRDDGYGGSVSEENAYRFRPANVDGYMHAFKQPSAPALRYVLDIAKERITYNRSLVSRKDEASRSAKEARILPKTPQRFYATAAVSSLPKLGTRHLRSFQGDTPGIAPWSFPTSMAATKFGVFPARVFAAGTSRVVKNLSAMKGNDVIFRRTYSRTTESWKFGYKGHAAVITGPRAPDRLRRRESIRYASLDQNDLSTSDEKRSKNRRRRVHRTAMCLLVACSILMAITVCLVIAALWLRSRYRSQGTALYSTLEVSDPDLPAYLPADGPLYRPASPQLTEDDLSFRREGENAELPRKLAGQSISAPVMWTSKAADHSPDGREKVVPSVTAASPEPISFLPQMQSAPASEFDVSKTTLSPVASEPESITHYAEKKRKSLHMQPSKLVLPQRSFSASRSDVDQTFGAESRFCSDDAVTPDPYPAKLEDRDLATAKANCEVITSKVALTRKDRLSEPTVAGLPDVTTVKGDACRAKGEQNTCELRRPYVSTSSTEQTSSIPEIYPRNSDSDDFRIGLDTSPLPLPTIIRRSLTKTTRRWGTAGADTTATSTTHTSSCEPRPQRKKPALLLTPPPQSSSTDSFESLAITKHNERPSEADCCYQAINTGLWFPLLALCKRSKPVDFLHVIQEDCQGTKLSWAEPGSGDVFHVLGSRGDRLVRVLRLRESDIPWHTSRLRVSRELSNLKDSVDNRTSAFFVGARTSLVRDKYARLLSNARMQYDDQFILRSATTSAEEPELVADYLVTEMQPGWCPLPNYKLTDPEQALSVLSQACWALAVAEAELEFEHRLPVAGAVLVRPTCSPRVEFTLRGHIVRIPSAGLKVRLQGLQLARIRIGTRVELTDFERFREFVKAEHEATMCAQIADLLSKRPTKFEPLTNVLWLQHLADWLASQYADAAPALSHWQGVLAASCSAEHATVGSRRSRSPSGTASP
ncbi:hypothetical protein HPB52_015906 [Rhipicephalus sanguineus]|uniref:Uncharacterized protein n=1 Tax=Rhipicephalus sanguineus TaxID=34632 RepID=A0A9D4T458_RHISA|nr:hypothetical protein HPB52_015906 [Rhipicephalus sanguineus]